ncbi:MAG: hypothetical protein M1830_000584 [Pleopsidium flavum]|nr:MAG: hypothetical protein M1830_000584 [Pleopsidium flavum]
MPIAFTIRNELLILICIFISVSSCHVTLKHGSSNKGSFSNIDTRQATTQGTCGFVGSQDIYGIGIRIGYYAQAFSTWFANFFVLREAKVLRAVNTLFMFAMFIGLIFISVDPSQTYVVEAYIMVQIIFTVWYVGATDVSKFSSKHWKFDFGRTFIRNGSFIGMVIYNAWYWWIGLVAMRSTPCGTFGYFLSRVALDGWYRKANMVLAIIAICVHVFVEFGYLFRTIRHFMCRTINGANYQDRLESRLRKEIDDSKASTSGPEKVDEFTVPDNGEDQIPVSNSELEHSEPHPEHDNCTVTQSSPVPMSPRSQISITPLPAASSTSDIDSSTQGSQMNSHAVYTAKPKSENDAGLPTFQELYAADEYISRVLSACPTPITENNRFQVTFFRGIVKIYVPYIRPSQQKDAVSLYTCLSATFDATRRSQLNGPAIAILLSHIYALQLQPLLRYPWLLHRGLTDPLHSCQNWRTLATISNIRITRLPDKTRKWYWIPSAIQTGVISIGLVLSIELTIGWNHISGVNQIGTVGQLIPFTLGIGGLVKVLWSWLQLRFRSNAEEAGEDGLKGSDVRLAEAYHKRKELYEKSVGSGKNGYSGTGGCV